MTESLRERVQDIASLARGMATRYVDKFRKRMFDIHPEAMAALTPSLIAG